MLNRIHSKQTNYQPWQQNILCLHSPKGCSYERRHFQGDILHFNLETYRKEAAHLVEPKDLFTHFPSTTELQVVVLRFLLQNCSSKLYTITDKKTNDFCDNIIYNNKLARTFFYKDFPYCLGNKKNWQHQINHMLLEISSRAARPCDVHVTQRRSGILKISNESSTCRHKT